jgi:hypothetical protein
MPDNTGVELNGPVAMILKTLLNLLKNSIVTL